MILLGYNPQLSELDAGTNKSCILEDALKLVSSLTVLLFSLPYLTFRTDPACLYHPLLQLGVGAVSILPFRIRVLKIILSSQILHSQLCKKTSYTHQRVPGLMKAKFFLCRLSTSLFQVFC